MTVPLSAASWEASEENTQESKHEVLYPYAPPE